MFSIGVLALQGDVEEHICALRNCLRRLNLQGNIIKVKLPKHLENIHALIIPGGESTTIGLLAKKVGLLEEIKSRIINGLPVFGTCAGMVMLAKEVKDSVVGETRQPILGVMNISVVRNIFGRQRESFEIDLSIPELGKTVRAIFIRAPAVIKYWGNAKPLATLHHEKYGELAVLVREDHMLASAFHPELTEDITMIEYFLNIVKEYLKK